MFRNGQRPHSSLENIVICGDVVVLGNAVNLVQEAIQGVVWKIWGIVALVSAGTTFGVVFFFTFLLCDSAFIFTGPLQIKQRVVRTYYFAESWIAIWVQVL